MTRLRHLAIVLVVVGCLAAPRAARASVVGSDGVIITAVALGTIGGLTTSIAALAFAVDQRTFTSPWMVASFFSAAVTGAMTVAIIVNGVQGQNVGALFGALFYGTITAWPGYWAVRTSLSEVEPGDYLDAEIAPAMAVDPVATLEVRRGPSPVVAWSFAF